MGSQYFVGTYKKKDRQKLNQIKFKNKPKGGYAKLYAEALYQTSPVMDDKLYEYISGIIFSSIADQAIDLALHPNKRYCNVEDNIAAYLYNEKELKSFMEYFNNNNGELSTIKCFIIYNEFDDFFCYEISNKNHYNHHSEDFFSNYCIKEYGYKVKEYKI